MRLTGGQHARITRKIINMDSGTGRPIPCCWDDCERDATVLYETVAHEHLSSVRCADVDAGRAPGRHYHYAFCSAGHKDLWDNATGRNAVRSIESTGRAYGNHSVGSRGTIL